MDVALKRWTVEAAECVICKLFNETIVKATCARHNPGAMQSDKHLAWGAHAPRVLAIAPSRSRTFPGNSVLAGRQNQHARARALPRKKNRAFTLIELLVIIAIIAI